MTDLPPFPPVPRLPPLPREPWEARIERSRWGYWIWLSSGLVSDGGPHFRFGRRSRAQRAARRLIARREREEDRRRAAQRFRIGPDGGLEAAE